MQVFLFIKIDTYFKMLKQIKWKSKITKKKIRQYITYLKNGLDLNLNDSFISVSYEYKIKQVQHEC